MGGLTLARTVERRSNLVRPAAPTGLRVHLLNGFRLTGREGDLAVPLCAQRLLAFLALGTRSMQRTYVASTLWLDCDESRAGGNLRSALWRVRSFGADLVEAGVDHVSLGRDVSVDLHASDELAQTVLAGGRDGEIDDLAEDALSGDVLPDWYDEWVVFERERHRQLRLHALEVLCEQLTSQRSYARAVAAGIAAVHGEPLRESAHRVLIKAHLAEGNRGEAVRQFKQCSQILRRELNLEPAPETAALVADCSYP